MQMSGQALCELNTFGTNGGDRLSVTVNGVEIIRNANPKKLPKLGAKSVWLEDQYSAYRTMQLKQIKDSPWVAWKVKLRKETITALAPTNDVSNVVWEVSWKWDTSRRDDRPRTFVVPQLELAHYGQTGETNTECSVKRRGDYVKLRKD